jgi:hypothetical protein
MTAELAIECLKTQKQFVDDMTKDAIDMAVDTIKNKLDGREIWKISSVFQNYYCIGLSEIAEEDEVCCSLFEKLGLLCK